MEMAGYTRIKTERMDKMPRKCANCGGKGSVRVTFKDPWSKLVVTLCKDCALIPYEDLHLQARFEFPAKA